jgi:hypothetical protein
MIDHVRMQQITALALQSLLCIRLDTTFADSDKVRDRLLNLHFQEVEVSPINEGQEETLRYNRKNRRFGRLGQDWEATAALSRLEGAGATRQCRMTKVFCRLYHSDEQGCNVKFA